MIVYSRKIPCKSETALSGKLLTVKINAVVG
jgi:hypothetical protein